MTLEKLWFSNTNRKTWSTVVTEPPEGDGIGLAEPVECPPQPGKKPIRHKNATRAKACPGYGFRNELKVTMVQFDASEAYLAALWGK
jgi:hypothetical protein